MLRLCVAIVLSSSVLGIRIEKTGQEFKGADHLLVEGLSGKAQTTMEADQHNKKEIQMGHIMVEKLRSYQFADFVREFKRSWQPGTEEWKRREEIFKTNMQSIIDHHSGPAQSWSKGVNKFMDYTDQEFKRLLGQRSSRWAGPSSSLLQLTEPSEMNTTFVTLPIHHNWHSKLVQARTFQRDQGACGSCWAFAAIEALEGHLEIAHGRSTKLSAQFLVSCMPNLMHCGGTGGCEGATANLAFDYIKENGIPAEQTYPYRSGSGNDGQCNQQLRKQTHVNIGDWVHLPVNKDAPLAQALYQHGPVVVSVDGTNFALYSHGVFAGCGRNAIINHAVVAEGFGQEFMNKYYLIKNSWGSDWGENGYIRLQRFENDNAHCGIDDQPEMGNGCDGGPKEIPVCGMCGVTSDSAFPRLPTFVEN